MKKLLILILLFISPLPIFAAATSTPEGWTDDFEAAKKQAIKEKKILLVDFTGTDWCKFCQMLESEVLSKKEFVAAARKNFVLVFIDIPNNTARLSPLGREQNKKIVTRYRITSFPTIALMDPSGMILDRAGYQAGGHKNYLQMLESKLAANKEKIKKMREIHNARGATKAKKIDAFLTKKSIDEQKIMIDWVKELVAIDSGGSLGLRKKYAYFTDYLPVYDAIQEFAGKILAARREYFSKIPADKKNDKTYMQAESKKFTAKYAAQFKELREKVAAARKKLGKNADPRAFSELKSTLDFLEGVPES